MVRYSSLDVGHVAALALAILALRFSPSQSPRRPMPAQTQPTAPGRQPSRASSAARASARETSCVSRTANGWLISAPDGWTCPSISITTKFELTYAADWQPQQLVIEGRLARPADQPVDHVRPDDRHERHDAGRPARVDLAPDRLARLVLPNNFFAAYEALALRLDGAAPGTRCRSTSRPTAKPAAVVIASTPRRMSSTPERRRCVNSGFTLTMNSRRPGSGRDLGRSRHRLARLVLPTSLARRRARRPRHRDGARGTGQQRRRRGRVFIPANGFSLGATITKPVGVKRRAGSGRRARRRSRSAGSRLHDLRHSDVRPAGRRARRRRLSRGALRQPRHRPERRPHRERRRSPSTPTTSLSIVAVAAQAAGRRRRIALRSSAMAKAARSRCSRQARRSGSKGVALVGVAGPSGREVTLEQQQLLLSHVSLPEGTQTERIALQKRVIEP